MRPAANLAWDRKWSRAIKEYKKALGEFPRDVTALTGLGLAYAETGQPKKALDNYRRAAELSPDSPEMIKRVGQMLERLAEWPKAADAYALAADACLRLRDTSQATELWQKAVILDPENLPAHRNLAKACEDQGRVRQAARQHLMMARVQQRRGHTREAIEHCNAALELDLCNREARDILGALQGGRPLPDGPTARLQPDADGKRTLDSFVIFEDIELSSAALLSARARASPADMLRERSLIKMAEAAFAEHSDPQTMQVNLLLAQAADYQTRGLTDRAIEAYLGAINIGADTLAVHFGLGLLYQEKRDFARALEHLNQTLLDRDYVLGAHFAIGEGHYRWGRATDGLQHLLEALRIIDSHIVSKRRVDDLNAMYEQFRQKYATQSDSETTLRLARLIISLLSSKGWGQQVVEARRQLDSLAGGCVLITLAEMLIEPEAEKAMTALRHIQEYLEQNKLFAALEECLWAIQESPYYLPLHLNLADILIEGGRLDEAVQKYITVAEAYHVRGHLQRAVAIYRKALQIAPMDVKGRNKLIRMLLDARMIDQAMEQYMLVADAYYQLAQVNRAVEKYTEALKYAAHGDASRHWETNVLHRIGDIYMQRVDWRQAIRAYQRIKRVDDEDESARSYLVDLYFNTGQRDQALSELDELIEFYKARRQPRKLLSVLQAAVRSRPDELELHKRLARLFFDMRMKEEAIAEMNTVGEIQLSAGMTRQAIHTLQAIIRLGPDDVQAYRQLLAQLKNQ